MNFESGASKEKSATLEMLKEAGMSLEGYYNAIDGRPMQQGKELVPNTWNENSGVIAFVDDAGKFYAVPSTDRYRSALMADSKLQKASIGVPALGNPEIWHKEPGKGEEIPGFQKWQALTANASGIRELESATQAEADAKESIARDIRSASGGEVEPTLEELEVLYRAEISPREALPESLEATEKDFNELMDRIKKDNS